MKITLHTVWYAPDKFPQEDILDEGIAILYGSMDEFQIEGKPEQWKALVDAAKAEHQHVRVVQVEIELDDVLATFAPGTTAGTVSSS